MNNQSRTNRPTAIVTGGSRGLGQALTAGLVSAGWAVVVDGRDEPVLRQSAALTGGFPIPGDVRCPEHQEQLVTAAHHLGGSLDLVVNNAGSLGPSPLPPLGTYDLDELRAVFEANVIAPLGLLQVALPLLRASKGAVLNITSDAAVEGYPGWGGYGASKAALEQLSRCLAGEEPDVAVWWVDPGDMRTAMHQAAFPGEDISDRPVPETVVPVLLSLLAHRPVSGRYTAAELRHLAAGPAAVAAV